MSRQIELALVSLIPSYGRDLPPSLIELAGSLLAQSLNRASTLKAEEEVARRYACANIACDRLKITLDLPPIEPRPPVPPRIYKRLYTHLDNILPHSSAAGRSTPRRNRTPSSKVQDTGDSPASQSRPLPSRGTPSKETSLAKFRTSSRAHGATPTRSTRNAVAKASNGGLNPWVEPVLRFMCTEGGHAMLTPTVLAGMEFILMPGEKRTQDEWANDHVTDVVAAIYFFVVMRLRSLASMERIDRESYMPLREQVLALLARAREEVTVKGLDEAEAWVGWMVPKPNEFDDAVDRATDEEWLNSDWYSGIADVMQSQQHGDIDMLEEVDPDLSSEGQVRRADTMFQEKYDYLSETRRADYKKWKEEMLSKISALTSGNGDEMELDS